ncbi:MAG: peptidylprolyl isomerase [Bacteroidia bacterium]|nr:peptidylprolyl isomerase [Bacteroidia bacterium]NNK28756.1 peptidylprolyl isomerase [Flavobacteriaceae bacterium]
MKNFALIFLFVIYSLHCSFAQMSNADVLFTVDDEPVYVDEFKRVYKKNLDLVKDETQKDIDNYLELFINYKLKLKEAHLLGLHETSKYKKEFASYRRQLAKNYLTDIEVTEALINEAYDRTVNEIRASHILIRVPENAPTKDTIAAYNKLLKARNEILAGEDFEVVARRYSEDPTAQENGGDLGFFGGFGMVYDFEDAAYNTAVGDVSNPFRTKFGFHIVKKTDMRKSSGKLSVAHIMIANKKEEDSLKQDPEDRINDIHKKLMQGETFETLAKQFSEDKASAKKGGLLNKFGKGQLSSSAFEDAAFGLKEKGDISQPINSDFGWHIIKLIDKHPVASFEEMKSQLESRIKRGSRSKIITSAFKNKLKEKYDLKINKESVDYFNSILNENFYERSWEIPKDLDSLGTLTRLGKNTLTYGDFAKYLLRSQRKSNSKKPFMDLVRDMQDEFLGDQVLRYYEDNLEEENEEFKIIVEEYRDGLLLFDLMESEVWNAAKKDSVGLQEYFAKNSDNYILPTRIIATVASSNNENVIKKVGKYFEKGWDEDKIKKAVNKKGKLDVIFTMGTMERGHQALPNDVEFKKGVSPVYKHNDGFVVVKVDGIEESRTQSFEEAKGKLNGDFQAQVEIDWLSSLRDKFQVSINSGALQRVKNEINNE